MSYGEPFSFAPSILPTKKAPTNAEVMRDLLIGILGRNQPVFEFDPVNRINNVVPPFDRETPSGMVPYLHNPVKGRPFHNLPITDQVIAQPVTPDPVRDLPPEVFAPGALNATKSDVVLPPGFFPPTSPVLRAIDTNVTPRPILSPLPDPITRNRRGEAREAMKGAGIAALLGLLAGGGRGALAAAGGFGQGAKVAADERFADAQEAQRIKTLQQERADQNRMLEWQNAEAQRQARNEGILDERNIATNTYNQQSDAYNRRQTETQQRRELARRAKKDAEDLIDADLDRELKKTQIQNAKDMRLTPEQQLQVRRETNLNNRLRSAEFMFDRARTEKEREYWGREITRINRELGNAVPAPPTKGGQIVITPKEERAFRLKEAAQNSLDKYRNRMATASEQRAARAGVAKSKDPEKIQKSLNEISKGIVEAKKDYAGILNSKPKHPGYPLAAGLRNAEKLKEYKAQIDAQYQAELGEWEIANKPALEGIQNYIAELRNQETGLRGSSLPARINNGRDRPAGASSPGLAPDKDGYLRPSPQGYGYDSSGKLVPLQSFPQGGTNPVDLGMVRPRTRTGKYASAVTHRGKTYTIRQKTV